MSSDSACPLDSLFEIGVAADLAHLPDQIVEGHSRYLDRVLERFEQPGTGTLVHRQADHLDATHQRATRSGVLVLAHEHVAQRRLAGAVRPHQCVHFTKRDLDVHPFEDLEITKRGTDIGYL